MRELAKIKSRNALNATSAYANTHNPNAERPANLLSSLRSVENAAPDLDILFKKSLSSTKLKINKKKAVIASGSVGDLSALQVGSRNAYREGTPYATADGTGDSSTVGLKSRTASSVTLHKPIITILNKSSEQPQMAYQ